MKNLYKLLVVCLALVSTTNYAQKTKYGVRTGVSIPSLNSKDNNIYSKDYLSVTGFDFSVFGDFGITENFSIKAELGYVRKGGERNGMQPIPPTTIPPALGSLLPPGTAIWAEFDNKAVFNYIEIPVLAKYEWHLGSIWGIYVNAGPYIDFMINPKQVTSSENNLPIYLDENETPLMVPYPPDYQTLGPAFAPNGFTAETDISKDLATVDFGAMLGVGASVAISDNSEILFDIRGAYGFIPMQNDVDTYGSVHMGNVSFALGYAYTIKSKTKKVPVD